MDVGIINHMQTINLKTPHPVDILMEKYIEPFKISKSRLGKMMGINRTNASRLLDKKLQISNNIAIRLAKVFMTTPEYWLKLQYDYNLSMVEFEPQNEIDLIDYKTYINNKLMEEHYG